MAGELTPGTVSYAGSQADGTEKRRLRIRGLWLYFKQGTISTTENCPEVHACSHDFSPCVSAGLSPQVRCRFQLCIYRMGR